MNGVSSIKRAWRWVSCSEAYRSAEESSRKESHIPAAVECRTWLHPRYDVACNSVHSIKLYYLPSQSNERTHLPMTSGMAIFSSQSLWFGWPQTEHYFSPMASVVRPLLGWCKGSVVQANYKLPSQTIETVSSLNFQADAIKRIPLHCFCIGDANIQRANCNHNQDL